jgi:hypothetical protein
MSQDQLANYRKFMHRRQLLLAAGACIPVLVFVGCGDKLGKVSRAQIFREDGMFFDAAALSIVDTLSEFMIPGTDTPGARSVDAAGFADGMMAGWARDDTRANVAATLQWLDTEARSTLGRPFLALAADDKFSLAETLDAGAFVADVLPISVARGYLSIKRAIYTGYYLSEVGATQELQYDHVPGVFRGCVPLEQVGRTWAA